jgi:hypothetical protein
MMKWKQFGRKRPYTDRDTLTEFSCRDRGIPHNPSARKAEIRTEHLLETSEERNRYSSPFGKQEVEGYVGLGYARIPAFFKSIIKQNHGQQWT